MTVLKHAACLLLAVSLIVILFCVSVVLPTFSVSFYMNEYKKYDLSEYIRVSEPDLERVTKNVQRYMAGLDPELNVEAVVAGIEKPFFNEREIFHMNDVRGLFAAGFAVMGASVLISAVCAVFIIVKKYYRTAAGYVVGCVTFLLLSFGTLAALVAVYFERAFVIFHELFFDNDMWLLDPDTDLLINLVPQTFFIDISKTIAICFFTGLAAALVFGIAVSAASARRRARNAG